MALIEKPADYKYLNENERKEQTFLDVKISLLKDRIKQAQIKQLRKFERGPLSQIKNKEKLQDFLQKVI